jgi:choline dehydrogenase-like flavoprotein
VLREGIDLATDQKWDFAVVGGGIAGLAISELLQRSGASVVLLEKNKTLCSEASAEQQGWFHTGALYTALPDQFFFRAMVGNLDDLIDYYRGFPNMNLRIDKHVSSASCEGGFRIGPISMPIQAVKGLAGNGRSHGPLRSIAPNGGCLGSKAWMPREA